MEKERDSEEQELNPKLNNTTSDQNIVIALDYNDRKLDLPCSESKSQKVSRQYKSRDQQKLDKSMKVKQLNDLLPSSDMHSRNRIQNKKRLNKSLKIEYEEPEEKTIDEKIQELIQKKLINRSVTPVKEFKYSKLVLSSEKDTKLLETVKPSKKTAQEKEKPVKTQPKQKQEKDVKQSEKKITVLKGKKYENTIIKNYDTFSFNPAYQKMLFKKTLMSSKNLATVKDKHHERKSSQMLEEKQNKRHSTTFSQISELVKQVQNIDQKNEKQHELSKRRSLSQKKTKSKKEEKRYSSIRAMSPTKHFTQDSYASQNLSTNLGKDYEENIEQFHQLLLGNKLVKALKLLDLIIERESGENKIKTLVILSDFYIQSNHLDKALMTLHSTILYV